MENEVAVEAVEFDIHERRILGLPLKGELKGPEVVAIRKIIDTFPLILDVAECRYDSDVAKHALITMAQMASFDQHVRNFQNPPQPEGVQKKEEPKNG